MLMASVDVVWSDGQSGESEGSSNRILVVIKMTVAFICR